MQESEKMAPQAPQEGNVVTPAVQTGLNTPSQFVNKMSSLPIVTSAFDVAKHIYDGTKEKYQVVERVEGLLVENLVPRVVNATSKATPAIVTLGLTQLDSFACTSLDILEQRVPLLKEHPSQIVHVVSGKVSEGVQVIDQLVETALVFSEDQIEYILPETQSVPHIAANGEANGHPEQPSKKQRIGTISRAHNLGVNISKRISQKAQQQLASQKVISVEAINFASALVEKQLGRLKVNFDSIVNLIQQEDLHLRKLFETYTNELRASFAAALTQVEKMSHGTVLDTTLIVLDSLSKSISQFVTKTGQSFHQLSESTNDPILKKFLEGAFVSLNYIQEYSQYLGKFTILKPQTIRTVNQPNETVFGESIPETKS